MKKIRVGFGQFQEILGNVFDVSFMTMTTDEIIRLVRKHERIKIEEPIERDFLDVKAVRVYLPELEKEINQTVERGELPRLLIKSTRRRKTGTSEVEIVFLGGVKDRHIENLQYFKKPPEEWVTWGEIVLTPAQARAFIEILKKMVTSN